MKYTAKKMLIRINMYDGAKCIGLNRIYEDDVFIVSYPKSGNTWVRFLIACMVHPGVVIHFRNIEKFVPDMHKSRDSVNSMRPPRFIKTHYPMYEYFPKFIYIYRDGRDVMVSYYYYEKQGGGFTESFSSFIRSDVSTRYYGSWHEHVSKVLDFASKSQERVLMLQYESMLESPLRCAYRIAEFCGLSVTIDTIEAAVRACSFNNLQWIEKKFGPERKQKLHIKFFRSGKASQWKELFSRTDLEYFISKAGETLRRLGYIR